MIVVQELGLLLDNFASTIEPFEDSVDISSLLHRNNAELIFFIDPNKESLVLIVVDSATYGPVLVQTASIKEPITLLEEEVVFNKLILCGLIHSFKRVERASQVTVKIIASLDDMLHYLVALFVRDSGAKREVR